MQREAVRGTFLGKTMRVLSRMFPTPHVLTPHALGIDISDTSIKWILLSHPKKGQRIVESFGQETLPEGIVISGIVRDEEKLTEALRLIKKRLPHIDAAHAALPEEAAFVFDMHVPPGSTRAQILNLIEFEFEARVPIPPSASVYDFDPIPDDSGEVREIGVVVFPRDLAESYANAFAGAGFTLLSLELEARSIARASLPLHDSGVSLLVDFGLHRTGFAVLNRGIPIFTSTVDVGGDAITNAVAEKLKLSAAETELWKNEQGLLPEEGAKSPGLEAVSGIASALGGEVARHFNYWDTRRNEKGERETPVSRVLLVGGSSNLRGLDDYISSRVQAHVERPNVWVNVSNFDEYIPPIGRRNSLQYATAIGLALRSV
ncbi:MAG TPA: pilus assembly protein PilM [Candidatus Paceibacterota bacterium]|nr:pilus assembly protein PilM [Candidatus Paceibacterota bacterium]